MNEKEAVKQFSDRYDCEVYVSPWGMHIYHGRYHLCISWEEDKQKWGWGDLYENKKPIWSTKDFSERIKLTTEELFAICDQFFPKRKEISLF